VWRGWAAHLPHVQRERGTVAAGGGTPVIASGSCALALAGGAPALAGSGGAQALANGGSTPTVAGGAPAVVGSGRAPAVAGSGARDRRHAGYHYQQWYYGSLSQVPAVVGSWSAVVVAILTLTQKDDFKHIPLWQINMFKII
jgi:hypothetical protein